VSAATDNLSSIAERLVRRAALAIGSRLVAAYPGVAGPGQETGWMAPHLQKGTW